jgi:antitoxin (DNA-binding transcriptional repressor) of toxin-antitoxin stability system
MKATKPSGHASQVEEPSLVGAFQAKTELSRLPREARSGKRFNITRRGKPVAELRPIQPTGKMGCWGRKSKVDSDGERNNNPGMTVKEHALQTIKNLPEDVDWEEVKDRIEFRAAVEKGIRELDEGKGIAVEDLEKELKQWTSR